MINKKGQVTIYVIIGIVIVVAGLIIFSLRGDFSKESVPSFAEPVERSFLNCIEEKVYVGIKIIESKGGYIENPAFVAGSNYQPFSSELDFAGVDIPYWYYLKGSNIEAIQIPTKVEMQEQFENYLEEAVLDCDFEEFRNQGYGIRLGDVNSQIEIGEDYVDVEVRRDLTVNKDSQNFIVRTRNIRVNSNLGNLYSAAVEVYEKENRDLFLENYSVDNLRLNLPVDGFELTCSPMSWNAPDLFNDYVEALEVNTILLNNRGEKGDYYGVDFSSDVDLRFIYSSSWPTYFEVNPTQGNRLIAKPIGNQEGLGVLGFCYVPYHFVYDIRHPVLIQVSQDDETFQFPVVVIIDGNVAKKSKADGTVSGFAESSQICEEMNLGEIDVSVYDFDLEEIDAELTFSCYDSTCELGYTNSGRYSGSIPQCVNGILKVTSPGYKTEKVIHSTVQNSSLVIVLEKEYEKEISLNVDGRKYLGNAMITFNSDESSQTVFYPEKDSVNLSSGEWEIQVYLIANTSIDFPETTQEQCYDVPRSGPLGLVGLTKTECTSIVVPQQIISEAIVGGDTTTKYFNLNDLENSMAIELSDLSQRVPTTIEELQVNYALLESGVMDVELI